MPPHGSDTGMIETTTSDGVCVLHLNAPPLNTMTFEMLD